MRPGGNIKKDSTYYNMADNELDALTANLYVDFLGRRAVADLAKSAKIPELAKVDEASDDQDEASSRFLQAADMHQPRQDLLAGLPSHKQKDFRVSRGGHFDVDRARRPSPIEEEHQNTHVRRANCRNLRQKTWLEN